MKIIQILNRKDGEILRKSNYLNNKQMKLIATIMFLFLFCLSSAQSLYRDRTNSKISYSDEESFVVTFEQSAYGITFKQNDRNLDDELKARIKNFMQETNEPQFRKLGKIELQIIKRNQTYYIVAQKSPERLLELKSSY